MTKSLCSQVDIVFEAHRNHDLGLNDYFTAYYV